MTELPTGWATATVEELAAREPASITDGPFGSALKRSHYTETGARVVRLGNLGDGGFVDEDKAFVPIEHYETLRRHKILPGDILVAALGEPLGRACLAPVHLGPAIVKADCFRIRSHDALSASLLVLWLNSPQLREAMLELSHGLGRIRINLSDLKSLRIPVPPKREQRRIVAKLDSLRARSARARQELDHIPKLIERYKQAILAKAFSGELTADWREQHPGIGTGAEVLAKIETARIALLEDRILTRRGPVSDGEAGRIPVKFSELPVTWEQSSLEAITSPVRLIQYGILKPGDNIPGGVPYVKVMNIQGGHVRLDRIRRTTSEIHAQYRRSAIATGDILLSIRGTVGRLAFVPPELDGGNITQDSVRIDVLPSMNARFVYWYLHSPAAQDYFAKNQKGVAVRGINVGDVRPMEIPIPPEAEQVRIVTLVECAFAWLDKIATEHARAEHLLPKLDQAILAKAFRGELVPQDPNDEPASVLLERINAERERGEQPTRRRARSA